MSSRIACCRLTEVLRDHPELRDVSRLALRQSCLPLAALLVAVIRHLVLRARRELIEISVATPVER